MADDNRFELEGISVCIPCKPQFVQMVREGVSLDPLILGAKELKLILGENASYYFDRFAKMRERNWVSTWNWVAFFFPAPWFCYRKMYGIGVAIFFGMMLLQITLAALGIYEQTAVPAQVLPRLGLALFGNTLYRRHVHRIAEKVNAMGLPEEERLKQLVKRGGVNGMAATLAVIIPGLLGFISAFTR